MIEPIVEGIARNRKKIQLPSNKQLIAATRRVIEELMDTAQPA